LNIPLQLNIKPQNPQKVKGFCPQRDQKIEFIVNILEIKIYCTLLSLTKIEFHYIIIIAKYAEAKK
jgi:hypothetical protein